MSSFLSVHPKVRPAIDAHVLDDTTLIVSRCGNTMKATMITHPKAKIMLVEKEDLQARFTHPIYNVQ
jgi:hypothetical protein